VDNEPSEISSLKKHEIYLVESDSRGNVVKELRHVATASADLTSCPLKLDSSMTKLAMKAFTDEASDYSKVVTLEF